MSAARAVDLLGQLGDLVDEEFVDEVQRAVIRLNARAVSRSRGERRGVDLAGPLAALVRLQEVRRGLPKWALAPGPALTLGQASGRLVTLAELDGTGLVALSTARRWCAEGRITARKVGRSWLVLLEDVERLVQRRER